jgi:integrase
VKGSKRFKAGAWRLRVDGPRDPITGKRVQVNATVRAPDNRAGAKAADAELAKMILQVERGETLPRSGVTVGELLERWVEHRRPSCEERSPGQPDATLARMRNHIIPKIGKIRLEKLRPVDIDQMYSKWRADGMAESTVRRLHSILHAALHQAMRWDLITSNPADRIEAPRPARKRRAAPSDKLLTAILAAADADMICYLRLAAVTGARRGQMVALRC